MERSFAHMYETGGMRRTHLRCHDNIIKRLLIHAGAFNLSLVMRKTSGRGTPEASREGQMRLRFSFRCLSDSSLAPRHRNRPAINDAAGNVERSRNAFSIPPPLPEFRRSVFGNWFNLGLLGEQATPFSPLQR